MKLLPQSPSACVILFAPHLFLAVEHMLQMKKRRLRETPVIVPSYKLCQIHCSETKFKNTAENDAGVNKYSYPYPNPKLCFHLHPDCKDGGLPKQLHQFFILSANILLIPGADKCDIGNC